MNYKCLSALLILSTMAYAKQALKFDMMVYVNGAKVGHPNFVITDNQTATVAVLEKNNTSDAQKNVQDTYRIDVKMVSHDARGALVDIKIHPSSVPCDQVPPCCRQLLDWGVIQEFNCPEHPVSILITAVQQ